MDVCIVFHSFGWNLTKKKKKKIVFLLTWGKSIFHLTLEVKNSLIHLFCSKIVNSFLFRKVWCDIFHLHTKQRHVWIVKMNERIPYPFSCFLFEWKKKKCNFFKKVGITKKTPTNQTTKDEGFNQKNKQGTWMMDSSRWILGVYMDGYGPQHAINCTYLAPVWGFKLRSCRFFLQLTTFAPLSIYTKPFTG